MSTQVPTANTDWLAVSTDGFAQQNAARPPEHLVKELVQNALDALPPTGGKVDITIEGDERGTWVHCQDNGHGISDMENVRTVFWTSKQDSHLKRGRMGRGFKEMLCLSLHTEVVSSKKIAAFTITSKGRRFFSIQDQDEDMTGTKISMLMPWDTMEIEEVLPKYFSTFLIPEGVTMTVNEKVIEHRKPKHTLTTTLTTEAFQNSRWVKPSTKTNVELVPLAKDEEIGYLYEMGIPICAAEWDVPYHANIQQRVPMNPNRDAVMSGYPAKIHKACLPTLLEELEEESARSAWVGEAAASTSDTELQKAVIERAFGGNIARSVPSFGRFDHDADAKTAAGVKILDTRQLSGGFRDLVKTHVPTSKEVADEIHEAARYAAASNIIDLEDPAERAQRWIKRYGKGRVTKVTSYYTWLCNKILQVLFPGKTMLCRVSTSVMADQGVNANWQDGFAQLTLALDLPRIWEAPFNHENFSLIIHETAKELAQQNGENFAAAVKTTGGAACLALFQNQKEIAEWQFSLAPGMLTDLSTGTPEPEEQTEAAS